MLILEEYSLRINLLFLKNNHSCNHSWTIYEVVTILQGEDNVGKLLIKITINKKSQMQETEIFYGIIIYNWCLNDYGVLTLLCPWIILENEANLRLLLLVPNIQIRDDSS